MESLQRQTSCYQPTRCLVQTSPSRMCLILDSSHSYRPFAPLRTDRFIRNDNIRLNWGCADVWSATGIVVPVGWHEWNAPLLTTRMVWCPFFFFFLSRQQRVTFAASLKQDQQISSWMRWPCVSAHTWATFYRPFLRGGGEGFHPPALKLEVIAVLGMRADYEEKLEEALWFIWSTISSHLF